MPKQYASRIAIPCRKAQVVRYHELLARTFGDPRIIPTRQSLLDVVAINPYSLIVATSRSNRVLGGIELYGLRKTFFDRYLKGMHTDADFKRQVFATPEETIRDRRLYIAITIPIKKRRRGRHWEVDREQSRQIRDNLLIACAVVIERVYLARIPSRSSIDIYAIAASLAGRALLRRAGFRAVRAGVRRRDGKSLFRFRASRQTMARSMGALMHDVAPTKRAAIDISDECVEFRPRTTTKPRARTLNVSATATAKT